MRMNGVNCSSPTMSSLTWNAALAAVTTISTTSSSLMDSLFSTICASGTSSRYSVSSAFCRPGRSHCSSTLSAGTNARVRSSIVPSRRLAIWLTSDFASRISLRCW